jgi:AraC family transcriptional regulator, regulatory protein of adaptative response / methylated-DNA-[protein]-cysteine methyltransferase
MQIGASLVVDEQKWQAVLSRLAAEDEFVYAVRTTGVYCRPSCPSRRPKRDSVEFFATAKEAEGAGYRPCLRCRPTGVAPSSELIERACRWLEAHVEDKITLSELAAALGISPFHLQRTFKRALGVSPRQYHAGLRAEAARAALSKSESVTNAIYDVGYGSSSRFYENPADELGMPPASYRKGGEGARIRYITFGTDFGIVLVAATERGVCKVSLGDSRDKLVSELRQEFKAAISITEDAEQLASLKEAVLDGLTGSKPRLDLPLDIQATAFERRVWTFLRSIPRGRRFSYKQVAEAVGYPTGARAIARACASNPAALVIPCHRVVGSDGELHGYRWGIDRKRALLDLEALTASEED